MINRIVLVGRLTKDPELRYTPAGDAVCSFSLAVNRNFKTNGEQVADFLNIVVWKKQGENAATYLKKGSLAGVDGRVQTRNYEGQDGKRVYITEIVAESVQFLEPKSNDGNTGNNQSSYGNNSGNSGNKGNSNYTRVDDDPFANDGKTIDIDDSSLPF